MNIRRIAKSATMLALLLAAAMVDPFGTASTAEAGGGGCHGSPEREGAGTRVALSGNCFSPIVLNVEPGDTVVFENMDDAQHDITGAAGSWGARGELLGKGATASVAFTEPGLYPYSCYLHVGMTGVIVVGGERSVSGRAPGEMTVSRVPVAPQDAAAAPNTTAGSSDSEISQWLLTGGGVLVGLVVATGAYAAWARR